MGVHSCLWSVLSQCAWLLISDIFLNNRKSIIWPHNLLYSPWVVAFASFQHDSRFDPFHPHNLPTSPAMLLFNIIEIWMISPHLILKTLDWGQEFQKCFTCVTNFHFGWNQILKIMVLWLLLFGVTVCGLKIPKFG